MAKIILGIIALATVTGIGIPLMMGLFGGGNEATRLADATARTQTKAEDVSRTYNDVIPPASPGTFTPTASYQRSPTGTQGGPARVVARPGQPVMPVGPGGVPANASTDPEATVQPELQYTPGEHAVADAMFFLTRIHNELEPNPTEYTRAVDRLKRAWQPRYDRAASEYDRFEERVLHAEQMGYEYLELQQRLTDNIQDAQKRRLFQERDAKEQRIVLDWINKANDILADATAIMADLDDMNIAITKLELSATFDAVYQSFTAGIPIAMTLLNEELARFEEQSEEIYRTFGPGADSEG